MTTMKDVANEAGVSMSTVSRALSGRPGVGKDLRAAIREAAARAGYVPNRVASNLRRQATTAVWGLLISDIQNTFFTALVRAVEDVARDAGYTVILCNSDEDVTKESEYVDVLVAEHVSGLLITPEDAQQTSVRRAVEAGIPVVAIDRRLSSSLVDTVLVDNRTGARMAVSHLLGRGATRVAILNGRETFTSHLERHAGYRDAIVEAGLEVDEGLAIQAGAHNRGAAEALHELLAREVRPDALFIANNSLTVSALPVLAEAGVAVPEDLLVACFDDLPLAAFVGRGGLTVVDQPTYEVGRRAAGLLLDRIHQPDLPVREHVLSPRLLVRGSTMRP